MWTRKRTFIGGRYVDNDWMVLRHGQEVGRVYSVPVGSMLGPHFSWSTLTLPPARGRADTLDEALEQMRETIRAQWPDGVALPMCAPS